MNRKQYIIEQVKKAEKPESTSDYIDRLQGYADFVGLIPGVGDIVDVGSALVDVAQGQYGDAAFRGAAALPLVGSAIGASKGVRRALGLASIAAPAAGGVMRALQPDDAPAGDGGRAEVQKAVKQNTAKLDQKAEKPEESESDENKGKFDISSMYNTRLVDTRPLQQFRSLQVASFQHSLDNTTDVLTESIIKRGAEYATDLIKKLTGKGGKKAGKETAEEAAERLAKETAEKAAKGTPIRSTVKALTGGGLGSMALIGGGAAAAGLLGNMFGTSGIEAGGQPLVPGSGGQAAGDSGVGAVGSVIDRLTSAYGYIPGFNPAGLAIQTLGKRVGAV
tara:strand:+ start:1268 stop:2272 length:1005 start_codon:yes stop_codon:yes gene_type:complete